MGLIFLPLIVALIPVFLVTFVSLKILKRNSLKENVVEIKLFKKTIRMFIYSNIQILVIILLCLILGMLSAILEILPLFLKDFMSIVLSLLMLVCMICVIFILPHFTAKLYYNNAKHNISNKEIFCFSIINALMPTIIMLIYFSLYFAGVWS